MRIIAGSASGMELNPTPNRVRPTMDRIRGAIFSSLGDAVPGARVLDLFSGTGALGIEALSRGSASAVFVDREERCSQCIRRNLTKCKLTALVYTQDVFLFLSSQTEKYDLIFADPPYTKKTGDMDYATKLCLSQTLTSVLSPRGIFVLEAPFRFRLPHNAGWKVLKEKQAGETLVFLLTR